MQYGETVTFCGANSSDTHTHTHARALFGHYQDLVDCEKQNHVISDVWLSVRLDVGPLLGLMN